MWLLAKELEQENNILMWLLSSCAVTLKSLKSSQQFKRALNHFSTMWFNTEIKK